MKKNPPLLKNFIIIFLMLININVFATYPICHCLIGGTYIYETHFNSHLQGFEINFNRHYSSCIQSNYINSYGLNLLYGENYKEIGISYTDRLFKYFSGRGHGGWNFIYKLNPNIITVNSNNVYMLKPGVGATIYTGARTSNITLQAFLLYNYNIYLQKEQNYNNIGKHSIQLGLFIGFDAFRMGPKKD